MQGRKGIGIFLAIVIVVAPLHSFGYDLSFQKRGKVSSHRSVSVALVPYAEESSQQLDTLIETMSERLRRSPGIRLLPQHKTNALLEYYFTHVKRIADDKKVQQRLSEARHALLSGDFDNATKLLQETRRLIEAKIARGGSNEALYEVYLLEAKLHHADDNEPGVAAAYDAIVRLYPDLFLGPNYYSRWERGALAEAQAKLAAAPLADLKIESAPKGSEVFVNGVHRGITPLTLKKLPVGRYCVEIKTVHHQPYRRYIDLEPEQSPVLTVKLARSSVATRVGPRTVPPSIYRSDLELSLLVGTLGYHLGVDRIILVAEEKDLSAGENKIVYRMGVTGLGSIHQAHQVSVGETQEEQGATLLANELSGEIHRDVMKNPEESANQSVGSLLLHEKRRPFYKRPLFWVLVGSGAATGGVLGAVFGIGGAAATGGVVIGL